MQSTTLIGNLTSDPIIRVIENDGRKTSVVRFSVAVNRYFKKKNGEQGKDTTFVPCEAWDKGAEYIAENASKGSLMSVQGTLKNNEYETQDGVKVREMKLRVSDFKVFDRKNQKPQPQPEEQKQEPVAAGTSTDEDIPF